MFPDVRGHWAENDINLAAQLGIVRGYPDGTFKPDQNVTRAEATVFCLRTWKASLMFAGGFAAVAVAISIAGGRKKKKAE